MNKLTICIPTYKRNSELVDCLHSILEQESLELIVSEIIISDNNPKNKLSNTIYQLIKKNKIIKYNKNNENIGCHPNFLKLLLTAKSEWVLFVSDDDRFENKFSLKRIFEIINSYSDISLFFSSRSYYKNNKLSMISRLFPNSMKIHSNDYWNMTRVLRNGYEFTGFCINKAKLNASDIISCVKLDYPQIYIATVVGLRSNSYYLDEPLFRHTIGNEVHWKIDIDNTILSRIEIIQRISRFYPKFYKFGMLSLYEDIAYLILSRLFKPKILLMTIKVFSKNFLSLKNIPKLFFGFYSIFLQKIYFQTTK